MIIILFYVFIVHVSFTSKILGLLRVQHFGQHLKVLSGLVNKYFILVKRGTEINKTEGKKTLEQCIMGKQNRKIEEKKRKGKN